MTNQYDFIAGDYRKPEGPPEPEKSGRRTPTPKAYAGQPGRGPQGETCKTCAHYCRTKSGSGKTFRKCGLLRDAWTHGPGTDIKAGSPACQFWEKQE